MACRACVNIGLHRLRERVSYLRCCFSSPFILCQAGSRRVTRQLEMPVYVMFICPFLSFMGSEVGSLITVNVCGGSTWHARLF